MTLLKYKMIFGLSLLGALTVLAGLIALGKVHPDSSYGLPQILGCLSTLSGGFAAWAFGNSDRKEDTGSTSKTAREVQSGDQ